MERYETTETSLSGDAVVRSTRTYIDHPEIGRFVFQLLLSGRPLLRLGERLSEAISHVEELKRQQFPNADTDSAFAVLILALSQFAWSFSRQELAKAIGMSVEEADERFADELKRISELGLEALAGAGQP